ncbi:MAG: fimbrillin family protein, partial [Clostridiales bacterium]|nr:fimbrillin family protein [Clostridiales bacterium]
MKRTAVFSCFLLLLVCCAVEEQPDESLVLFAQVDAALTRATVGNTWEGGERVQVILDGDDDNPLTFIAAAGGALTPEEPLYWQSRSQTLSARAWYPASWGTMFEHQNTEGKLQMADFIFAPTVDGISLTNVASKPLTFYHKTAKVTATLVAGTGISSVANAEVYFYGWLRGRASTTDGALSGQGGFDRIYPLKSGDTHTALLIPRTYTSEAFIEVSLDGFDYPLYTPETLTLEAGKAYNFRITVNKTGLEVTTDSPLFWGEGSTEGLTAVPVPTLALEGIAPGTEITVKYDDEEISEQTISAGNDLPSTPDGDKIIRSIRFNGGNEILIGRKEGDYINLKFDEAGNLIFRDADEEGNILIGAYAEFQLINTVTGGLSGQYKQEADLDLMDVEWTPISNFSGTFEGGGHKLEQLQITQALSEGGLFGSINSGSTLSNIAIVSGAVTGTNSVGGVCGWNRGGIITACYNHSNVATATRAGGVCGWNQGGTLTACCNIGYVAGEG